ncbi:matrilysin-like [Ranitomeya imitator]|uniref:matrilysin-like n=1 Tax=Ranitomeya imitator TaxID=111125 RepID=UPI0037E73D04
MMQVHYLVLLSLCCGALAMPRPQVDSIFSSSEKDLAEKFLNKFYSSTATENSLKEKIEAMQRFVRLKVTGLLDTDTINMMKAPRCGMPDVAEFSTFSGRPGWQTNSITYRIVNYTPDLPARVVDDSIQLAFSVWSQVTPLRFTKVNRGNADILIQFSAGAHGDNSPFDGPDSELAHASAIGDGISSYAHFDEDEKWTNSREDVNLFLVAAHEFGHCLGLNHSEDPQALMYSYYHYIKTDNFRLPQDDVNRIQSLHGRRRN